MWKQWQLNQDFGKSEPYFIFSLFFSLQTFFYVLFKLTLKRNVEVENLDLLFWGLLRNIYVFRVAVSFRAPSCSCSGTAISEQLLKFYVDFCFSCRMESVWSLFFFFSIKQLFSCACLYFPSVFMSEPSSSFLCV